MNNLLLFFTAMSGHCLNICPLLRGFMLLQLLLVHSVLHRLREASAELGDEQPGQLLSHHNATVIVPVGPQVVGEAGVAELGIGLPVVHELHHRVHQSAVARGSSPLPAGPCPSSRPARSLRVHRSQSEVTPGREAGLNGRPPPPQYLASDDLLLRVVGLLVCWMTAPGRPDPQ